MRPDLTTSSTSSPSSRRIGGQLRPLLQAKVAASFGGSLEGPWMLRRLVTLTLTQARGAQCRCRPFQTTAAFFAIAPAYPRKQRLLDGRGR